MITNKDLKGEFTKVFTELASLRDGYRNLQVALDAANANILSLTTWLNTFTSQNSDVMDAALYDLEQKQLKDVKKQAMLEQDEPFDVWTR
jgi:hypothetical protein